MKILIISARSFGDCIVTLELISYIAFEKNIKIDIFTKDEFVQFFKKNININQIHTSSFPLGINAKFSPISLLQLFKKCNNLKKQNYDIVLNNIGDFRENFIGYLLGAKQNMSVKFSKNHPFNNLIRKGLNCLIDSFINIPDTLINVYSMQKYIAEHILNKKIPLHVRNIQQTTSKKIAIHPTASQKCRLWQFDKWVALIDALYKNDKITIFCTQNEQKDIEKKFKLVKDKVEIIASNIDEFLNNLKSVETIICLDSFAVHAAYYSGVKNIIMLNGANDFNIWLPPKANVVLGNFECPHYPCYNKPKCIGKDFEYTCIQSIDIQDVIKKQY